MDLETLKNEQNANENTEATTNETVNEESSSKKKKVEATDILPPKEHHAPNEEYVNDLFGDLEKAVNYKVNEIEEIKEENRKKAMAEELEKNDDFVTEAIDMDDDYEISDSGDIIGADYDDVINLNTTEDNNPVAMEDSDSVINTDTAEQVKEINESLPTNDPPSADVFNVDFDDDDDFKDLFEEEDDSRRQQERDEAEENRNILKEEIKKNLNETEINLSNFKIEKKAISASKVLHFSHNQAKHKTSDWGLFNSGKPITLTALSGAEVEKFNPNFTERNALQAYKEIYGIIYNHLLDENKPKTFEEWAKTIYFYDNPHLMFAVYKACFESKNILPYSCPNDDCKKTLFMENVPIERMVKYASEEAKERARQIIAKCEVNKKAEYETNIVVINNNYAIGFVPPTLYSVMFESLALDTRTREKYADILSVLSYIDEIYWIDTKNQTLIPISTSPVANNLTRTVKRKIKVYSEIINTFTSDEYNKIIVQMTNINNATDDITYVIPETHCPECGTLIEEQEVDPLSMVFERHQYVVLRDL